VVTDLRDGLNLGAEVCPSGSIGDGELDPFAGPRSVLRLIDMPRFFSLMVRPPPAPEETCLRNFAVF
jgi:hypothetical protein